jgi:hypothetical protein
MLIIRGLKPRSSSVSINQLKHIHLPYLQICHLSSKAYSKSRTSSKHHLYRLIAMNFKALFAFVVTSCTFYPCVRAPTKIETLQAATRWLPRHAVLVVPKMTCNPLKMSHRTRLGQPPDDVIPAKRWWSHSVPHALRATGWLLVAHRKVVPVAVYLLRLFSAL